MKIKLIDLYNFRRFKNITIKDIPEEARLVVMIGPNGSGKSSVFDALHQYKNSRGRPSIADDPYFNKFDSSGQSEAMIKVEFHTGYPRADEDWNRSIHIRTSYRNDLVDDLGSYATQTDSIVSEYRFSLLADNDQAVASNFGRILNQWIERSSATARREENIGDLQDEIFGELRDAIAVLFSDPELVLTSLGSLTRDKVFQFNKGTSHGFSYINLSSGEKAALDILLNMVVAKAEFNNTVFCIDEPEAHIHTKLQGPLLNQLYDLIPDNSQLWIATHSIGMVRKAQDLWNDNPDSVVFLNFGDDRLNFDDEATIVPTQPNPKLWEQTYDIALGDLAELVASEQYVFCEGTDFDETCYQNIFSPHYPETRFISMGGSTTVVKVVKELKGKIAKGAKVIGVVDGDNATCGDIERNTEAGVCTLSEKTIESYLLDDEVLTKLCEHYGKPNKVNDLLAAKQNALDSRGLEVSDNLKPIAQHIHGVAQRILKSVRLGNSKESFMRDILAPLIQPGMAVYEQLHKDIFGE